jgi:hypothetical protein
MPIFAPLSWLHAWADAFGAGLADMAGAGGKIKILRAGADGFTVTDPDGRALFLPYTDDLARAPAQAGRVALRLTAPDGLIRPLTVPAQAAGDLIAIADLNIARLAPIPAALAVWAIGAVRRIEREIVADVHIAAKARLQTLRDLAVAKGFLLAGADVEDPAAPDAAMQANLFGAQQRHMRNPAWPLAALVALLFGLAAFGWFGPEPPGAAARAQAAEIAAGPPLTALIGATAGALPDDAALTRLVRDGRRLRLEGEATDPEGLIDLVNGAGLLRAARLAAPPERAPGAASARFVIEAQTQ